jgi:hypothetical protein
MDLVVERNPAPAKSWRYVDTSEDRDLRIDFIRGMVMLVLIVVHIELFSLFNFLVWERIGVVSGGEGFVIVSGYVTGFVSRRRMDESGWKSASRKLLGRALQLWRVNVFAICLVALLAFLPAINLASLTTFTDRGSNQTYNLFPAPGASVATWVLDILLLRIGPHQLQILGLYVCLLLLSPLILKAISTGRTPFVLCLSWLIYGANTLFPSTPTGSQFESGFPLLTWQLLFVYGLTIGYHRARVWHFMSEKNGRYILVTASILFFGFLFWAQNTPNPFIPSYARLSIIPAAIYRDVYDRFMQKNTLGFLRLVNYACVLVVGYAVLTRFWEPLRRGLGWFLIPLGQASLYVFIIHIYVVAAVDNVLPFGFPLDHHDLWINTAAHTAALITLWLLVRFRVLFQWIPR